jgi:surface polysaccharide O-acyltransferase-like enzyme
MSTTEAISLVGAVLLIVSLMGPTWLALFSKSDASFSDLRTATKPATAPGVQHAYFGWLAWTLVIIAIVALAASILTVGIIRRSAAALAIVLAVVGIVLTLVCVKELDVEDPHGSFWTHFGWIRYGGYLHVVGWVAAIAAGVNLTVSASTD